MRSLHVHLEPVTGMTLFPAGWMSEACLTRNASMHKERDTHAPCGPAEKAMTSSMWLIILEADLGNDFLTS